MEIQTNKCKKETIKKSTFQAKKNMDSDKSE